MEGFKRLVKKIWNSETMCLIRCTGMGLAMFGALFFGLFPVIYLILNADRLGWVWLPALLAYFTLFIAASGWIMRKKKLLEERAIVGDEIFFQLHPGELRRELRRKARQARKNQE